MTPEQLEFSQRIRPHLGQLSSYVASRVQRQFIDDICSDVIATTWQRRADIKIHSDTNTDAILGFMLATARLQIRNLERKERTREHYLQHFSRETTAESAENEALRDEAVIDAFKALKPREREILLLSAWDGLDPAQIAVVLGISANNAAVRLSRSRSKFEQLLAKHDASHRVL